MTSKSSVLPYASAGLFFYSILTFVIMFLGPADSLTNPVSQTIFLFFNPLARVAALMGVSVPGLNYVWPTVCFFLGVLAALYWLAEKH